jgi:serine/threonine-protein kinase
VLAETLFREAKALMSAGNLRDACPKLAESFRQDPGTGTLLALAVCHEQAGNLASAWATYNAVIGRARAEAQTEREQAARERAAALEPRLSKLTIEIPPEIASLPGLTILRDGDPLPVAAWGIAIPLDPGIHLVEATADGKPKLSRRFTFKKDGGRKVIRIEFDEQPAPIESEPEIEEDPSPPRERVRPASPSPSETAISSQESEATSLRTASWIVGGAGILALGVAGGYALHAKSLDEDSKTKDHCTASLGCDEYGERKNRDALAAGNMATGFLVGGTVLVGAAITLFVIGEPEKSGGLRVLPAVGARSVGVSVGGSL